MRLYLAVEIDAEGSGIDPVEVEINPVPFARKLLIKGAEEMEVGFTLKEAACVRLPRHRKDQGA